MKVGMVVTGGPQLAKRYKGISEGVRGQMLETALAVGALQIVNRAKELAPYRTGNLRRSIHVGGHGGLEGNTTGTDIGGNAHTSDSARVLIGTNVEYAVFQEFGTSRMPAHPFLRPAFEERVDAARADYQRALKMLLKTVAA